MRAKRAKAAGMLLLSVAVVLGSLPPPTAAWEQRARGLVTRRAVDSLPYPLRAFFETHSSSIVRFATDPSLWGTEPMQPEGSYIRLDNYGRYPFAELPRDYNDAVRKFGRRKVMENGLLPWQVGTYSLKLEEAFRNQRWDQVQLYAGILSYYIAEAHDPFNTTGQLSNQLGVDQRYTRSLVERYQMFFIIRPGGAFKIDDPTGYAFSMVIGAHTWVDNILLADSQARAGKVDYNDDYYDAFYGAIGAVLILQLTTASHNVGAYWYSAWVNAGSPDLPAQ